MNSVAAIQQFLFEVDGWERLLDFLEQENITFKNRLSTIVNESELSIVVDAEKFNEDFISQDKVLQFLNEEIREQKKLLHSQVHLNDEKIRLIEKKQNQIRIDITKAEEIFFKLKNRYAQYLTEFIN